MKFAAHGFSHLHDDLVLEVEMERIFSSQMLKDLVPCNEDRNGGPPLELGIGSANRRQTRVSLASQKKLAYGRHLGAKLS